MASILLLDGENRGGAAWTLDGKMMEESPLKEFIMPILTCPTCGGSLARSECQCPSCGKLVDGSIKCLEPTPLTPELLEWAKQQFNEEETIAGIEEVKRTGGMELHEFIHELEAEAAQRE